MKTKIILSTVLVVMLTACSGGGSGSSEPQIINEEVIVPPVDDGEIIVPIDESQSDAITEPPLAGVCVGSTESSNEYITEEYCRNYALSYMKTSSAYVAGYTGLGVTIAVLDTGVDFGNYDIQDKLGGLSHRTFDSSGDVIRGDQIEEIYLSNSGAEYVTEPSVTILGDGSGAAAVAAINEYTGSVTDVRMLQDERGSGYEYATTAITLDDAGTGGSGATISGFRMGGYDDHGHGTSTSGVSASTRQQLNLSDTYDGYSVHGVAFNANIMSVKVIEKYGFTYEGSIINGIDYAVENNARIINMSLGGDDWYDFSYEHYKNAVAQDTIVVMSSGNSDRDCNTTDSSDSEHCQYPAAYPWTQGHGDILDGSGAWVVVGSVSKENVISDFSNRAGLTKNNFLVAYGEEILSPSINNIQTLNYGTSFSAPAVSGAMALMAEKFPNKTGKEIAQIFFDSAVDLGEPGCDDIYGHGLIDIKAAFELAAQRASAI